MAKRAALWGMLLLALSASTADARTWNVRKDGAGDYTLIQDAVDHAAAGDTIRIGPGRYEEYRPYTSYPTGTDKWTFDVYVAVNVSDLTLIGSGSDQTIIGPPTRIWVDPTEPKIICALSRVTRLVIEDLALENVFNGVYRGQRGTLAMRRCETRGCEYGVTSWSELGTFLESCRFQDIDSGVISLSPASNVTVQECSFVNCMASFERTANAFVSDSQFQGYPVGCQHANGSTGGVYNSTFTDQTNVGIVVATGSIVDVRGNTVMGSAVNLGVRTLCTVTGAGNVFNGGTEATIKVCGSDVQLHGNHILHGTGYSVLLECFVYPPVATLDLTNNYWGTTDTEQLAQWIWDWRDDVRINAVVNYTPLTGGPIGVEQQSWGQVKTLYGR